MCNPQAIVAVGSAVMKHQEKQDQADAENKAAREDYFQKVKQTQLATLQEQTSLSASLFEDTLVAKQNQATIYAGQEFQSGSLVGALYRNQRAIEARNANNIEDNFSMGVQQRQYEMQGYQKQSDGRSVQGPSPFVTGLEIYDAYNKSNP